MKWLCRLPWVRCWIGEHRFVSRLVLHHELLSDEVLLYRGYVCDHCGRVGKLTYKFK